MPGSRSHIGGFPRGAEIKPSDIRGLWAEGNQPRELAPEDNHV